MSNVIRVAQLSDTHFLEPGATAEGDGYGYDTSEAFEAILARMVAGPAPDLVVVTGDVTDHGRVEQYEIAAAALARIPGPVAVCPGNHDFDTPFRSVLVGGSIVAPRVTRHGSWAFVYVDSNAGVMAADPAGTMVDPPGERRLHSNGSLGETEAVWLRDTVAELDAEHVFVWLHHPPAADVPLCADVEYDVEWSALAPSLANVRGFGAGHTHVPSAYQFAGRQVFVAPSLKNNFDLTANTLLPPGYRTYEFHPDGTVVSNIELIDDDRWPRAPFGRAVRALFMGEISYAELADIVARRTGR